MADNTDKTIEDIKRLRTMHSKTRRKTSDASNSNDPTDSREHLPKSCIYARIKHHTTRHTECMQGSPGQGTESAQSIFRKERSEWRLFGTGEQYEKKN